MIDSSQAGLLGTGSFAEVRRGTYAFSAHSAPTEVAFKIFRGSQQIDASLRSQVRIAIRAASFAVRWQERSG